MSHASPRQGLPAFTTNMCGQRKIPMWFNLTSPMRVFHQSVGCNFRWLLHSPHIILALDGGHDYLNSLQTDWSGILEDVSFSTHLPMWCQPDSPPPHYIHKVFQWLPENYPRCGLVMDAKLRFHYLRATWLEYSWYNYISSRQELWPWIKQFVSEIKNLNWIFLMLASFFFMQSLVLCPGRWWPFWEGAIVK
jgi:hypothetical protein